MPRASGAVTADPLHRKLVLDVRHEQSPRQHRSGARARRRRRRLRRRLPGPLPGLADRDRGLLGGALRQQPAGRTFGSAGRLRRWGLLADPDDDWAVSPPRRPSTASSSAGGFWTPSRVAYRARVVVPKPERPAAPALQVGYKVLHSSPAESVTASRASRSSRQISTFPARLPIPAGAYVGLSVPSHPRPGLSGKRRRGDLHPDQMTAATASPSRGNRTTAPSSTTQTSSRMPITTATGTSPRTNARATPPRRAPAHLLPCHRLPRHRRRRPRSATSRPCRRGSGSRRAARWSPGAGLMRAPRSSCRSRNRRPSPSRWKEESRAGTRAGRRKGCARWVFVHAFRRNMHRGLELAPPIRVG